MPIINGGSDQLESSTYFGHDAHFKLLLCRSFYAVDKRCEILFIFFDVSHGKFLYKIIKIWISKRTLKCFIFLEEIVSYLVYLVQSEDFKLATELSEKVQYPHNRQ